MATNKKLIRFLVGIQILDDIFVCWGGTHDIYDQGHSYTSDGCTIGTHAQNDAC